MSKYELYVTVPPTRGFILKGLFETKQQALDYAAENHPGDPFVTNPVDTDE